MKCIILAGGFGTRLRSITGDETPKCMVKGWFKPGHRAVPWMDVVIRNLRNQGINDITLSLHYKANVFVKWFGDKVKYKIEDEPLGTGGAIKNCVEGTEPVLVLNGDTVADIDYHDMMKKYVAPLTIAINPEGISAGVYILNPNIFDTFKGESFSFEKDVIPNTVHSFYQIPWFNDIGTPEGYESAQHD